MMERTLDALMGTIKMLAMEHPIRARHLAQPEQLLYPFWAASDKMTKAMDSVESYEPTTDGGPRIAYSGHDTAVRSLFAHLDEQTDAIVSMAQLVKADNAWPDVFKKHREIWNGIKHLDREKENHHAYRDASEFPDH